MFTVHGPDVGWKHYFAVLEGAFYIADDERDLYLWKDGSIHGGMDCTDYPNDGCLPFGTEPITDMVFNYGWWKTKYEADIFLDKWNKEHDHEQH